MDSLVLANAPQPTTATVLGYVTPDSTEGFTNAQHHGKRKILYSVYQHFFAQGRRMLYSPDGVSEPRSKANDTTTEILLQSVGVHITRPFPNQS